MQRSLFEMLGIADQERIHTQVFAWLLSPVDSPLNETQRIILLNEVFDIKISIKKLKEVKVYTELYKLDLVIWHPEYLIVVENKIKSHQGVDQLKKYNSQIDDIRAILKCSSEIKLRKVFLTLSGEKSSDDWVDVDYEKLYNALSKMKLVDNTYESDYLGLLYKMLTARECFINDHRKYLKVFERSGMKTSDRVQKPLGESEDPVVKFISGNHLERIFIEILYRKVIEITEIKEKVKIEESRGRAMIHFDIFTFVYRDKKLYAGFQFQDNTTKLNISAIEYYDSNSDWLEENFINKLDELLKLNSSDYKRINAAKIRAYRSWSKKLDKDFQIEVMSIQDFSGNLNKQVKSAKEIWSKVLNQLKKDGLISTFDVY